MAANDAAGHALEWLSEEGGQARGRDT